MEFLHLRKIQHHCLERHGDLLTFSTLLLCKQHCLPESEIPRRVGGQVLHLFAHLVRHLCQLPGQRVDHHPRAGTTTAFVRLRSCLHLRPEGLALALALRGLKWVQPPCSPANLLKGRYIADDPVPACCHAALLLEPCLYLYKVTPAKYKNARRRSSHTTLSACWKMQHAPCT